MAVQVTKDSGDTTFGFSVTGPEIKIDPLLEKWAEYAYGANFGQVYTGEAPHLVLTPFDSITNQQKLDAINARLKALAIAEANAQEAKDTQAAKEAEKTVHDLSGVNGD